MSLNNASDGATDEWRTTSNKTSMCSGQRGTCWAQSIELWTNCSSATISGSACL